MIIDRQVPRRYVRRVAHMHGMTAHYTANDRVLLYPLGTKYRVGKHGEGKHACYHGYAQVIETILRRYPFAQIETILTNYTGLEDFLARQEEVRASLNRHPSRAGGQRCTCDEGAIRHSTLSVTSPREASRG